MGGWARTAVVIVALVAAAPAAAQLPLPRGLPLPSVGPLPTDPLTDRLGQTLETLSPRRLVDQRLSRLTAVVRAHPRELELDEAGQPAVRGEVLATSPSAEALAQAQRLGFRILRREPVDQLGLEIVTLASPPGLSGRAAVRRLRRADPAGAYDYNHLYFGAATQAPPPASSGASAPLTVRLGLIDTGLDARHPAMSGVRLESRGFAPGGYRPAGHGLAVASLLAGQGTSLYSADVYGAGPTGGSAEAVVRAMGWLAGAQVSVINVSLVGPPNRALQAAVEALNRRGVLVVAAVGNDGPAAPPSYPASYPGVVAVTGVDRRGKVLMEAGRASHVDFAAPGELLAAKSGGGSTEVRGTSFAAPIVARRLAMLGGKTAAVQALARQARDLGPKGPDKTYGHGLVGAELLAQR